MQERNELNFRGPSQLGPRKAVARDPAMNGAARRAAEPFTLGGRLLLRNRLVGTAHGTGLVVDGLPQPTDAEYWRRRAAGGAAMLIVGGTVTAPETTWRRRIVTEAWREESLPGMALRAEAIRSEGAVAACQLVHLGRETTGAEMWFPPVGPSAVRSPREPTRPRALTDGELDEVIEGFRVSALHAVQAGFQVIELHAAHGYLLAQFLSPNSNLRPDAESPGDRTTIVRRIVTAIRACAPDAVIGVRLSSEGEAEAGHTVAGLAELLPDIARVADYINLTVGVRTTYVKDMGTEEPPLISWIGRVRPLIDRPLLVSQAFRRSNHIAAALAAGADLVGIARPLISDPDFPAKILAGREAQVRPCVSCNEDCRAFDPVLLCSVNPELAPPGMTHRPASPLIAQRGHGHGPGAVAIVGAGPAGLECAIALARGSEVVLFDERDRLGGHLALAAAAPNRRGWQSLLDFYQAGLATAAVAVRLGTPVTVRDLDEFEHVVIATGSEELLPAVPGIERALSTSAVLHAGTAAIAPGTHVLIVDDGFGEWRSANAVELAIQAGAGRIQLVSPAPSVFAGLPAEARAQLLARLRGAPLELRAITGLDAITDSGALTRNLISGDLDTIPMDIAIVVGERRAQDWRALVPPGASVQVIGDAVVPRRVAHAIAEGHAAARAITDARRRLGLRAPASVQADHERSAK